MKTVRIELKEANEFVAKHHRHHKPVTGHRFSIAVLSFKFAIKTVVYEFNTTNFHICERCILKSAKKSIEFALNQKI